jgi:hypothetical protein
MHGGRMRKSSGTNRGLVGPIITVAMMLFHFFQEASPHRFAK